MNVADKPLQKDYRINSAAELTASQYLNLLQKKQISALEYVSACLDRIEALNGELYAFEHFNRERSESKATEIDQALASGADLGTMPGVPSGVKDIINVYDFPCARGTPILKDYMPGNDARVVDSFRRHGSIIVGKTVTAEFAVHHPGPTMNPYDDRRTPGTSSSGSAVAVATRMVPVSLATQTAGSIVRPASYCGVYGFKPSFGLIPRTGVLKTTDTLDTVGLMSRSVADLRLCFEASRVRGHNYPVSEKALNDPARNALGGRPWRVGIVEGPKTDQENPFLQKKLSLLIDGLRQAGMTVVPFRLPAEFNEAHDVHQRIYCKALSYYFKEEWNWKQESFSATMREMMQAGSALSAEQYHRDTERQAMLGRLLETTMAGTVDVLIGLSTADEAPHGLDAQDLPDHNLIWTMCGNPVLSLPHLTGANGLPVGVKIVARKYADHLLLDFADAFEDVLRG